MTKLDVLTNSPTSLENATGEIPFKLTNDYLFRAVLQKNGKVLEGLICSLLHFNPTDIESLEILNPIELGESIDNKEFRLDVLIKLNNNERINLEMQVNNLLDWPNRSLAYLCRTFDDLCRGGDYCDAKPAIHIGFLDYTLFEDAPEFYATYKMSNIKNHYVYNDNFTLSVINLNRIDLATDEDRAYEIDKWANLFKASTWDELKIIAGDNVCLKEAVETILMLTSEYLIRKRCQDREDYLKDMQRLADDEKIISEIQTSLKEKEAVIAEKDAEIMELRAMLATMETR